MSGTATIGIDLGTSSAKVLALSADDTVLAVGSGGFPTRAEEAGQAEQDQRDWMDAIAAAAQSVARGLGDISVTGIGLTGQMPTLVCHTRSGEAVPAITWRDGRADAGVARHLDEAARADMYRRTGMPIDGRYLAPMLRHHFAGRLADIARIMSAKDAICHALTGQYVTDPSTAAGYGVYGLDAGAWDSDLLAFWGIDPAILPRIDSADAVAGTLLPAAATQLGLAAGIPVTVGAADSVCAALAVAGCAEGTVCVGWGSSTVILDAVPAIRLDPERRYLVTPHALPGWFGREMDLVATGTGHQWLRETMGWAEGELETLASRSPPGARGLLFAPYLGDGEQGALWNPDLRGVIHGLSLRHRREDIARAFLEGTVYEIRRCSEVLGQSGQVDRVVLAGHPASSRFTLHLLADILRRPVAPVRDVSAAAYGAALLARQSPGDRGRPIAAGPAAFPGPQAGIYEALYDRYRATFPALAAAAPGGG